MGPGEGGAVCDSNQQSQGTSSGHTTYSNAVTFWNIWRRSTGIARTGDAGFMKVG